MNNKKVGLILTGGYIELDLLRDFLMAHEVLWVIAVDKGLMAAHALSLPVDMIVGDFDSVEKDVLVSYKNGLFGAIPKVISLQPEKDMTDTQVAIEQGMKLLSPEEEMVLLGATGTRMDHTLANINLLMIPLYNHVKACILDKNNKIYLKKEGFSLLKSDCYGSYISLLPFSEKVAGLTLQGFKYLLHQYTLEQGSSIGVSNEIQDEKATIDFASGILLVMESKD